MWLHELSNSVLSKSRQSQLVWWNAVACQRHFGTSICPSKIQQQKHEILRKIFIGKISQSK